jgi:hypothetical protein
LASLVLCAIVMVKVQMQMASQEPTGPSSSSTTPYNHHDTTSSSRRDPPAHLGTSLQFQLQLLGSGGSGTDGVMATMLATQRATVTSASYCHNRKTRREKDARMAKRILLQELVAEAKTQQQTRQGGRKSPPGPSGSVQTLLVQQLEHLSLQLQGKRGEPQQAGGSASCLEVRKRSEQTPERDRAALGFCIVSGLALRLSTRVPSIKGQGHASYTEWIDKRRREMQPGKLTCFQCQAIHKIQIIRKKA